MRHFQLRLETPGYRTRVYGRDSTPFTGESKGPETEDVNSLFPLFSLSMELVCNVNFTISRILSGQCTVSECSGRIIMEFDYTSETEA